MCAPSARRIVSQSNFICPFQIDQSQSLEVTISSPSLFCIGCWREEGWERESERERKREMGWVKGNMEYYNNPNLYLPISFYFCKNNDFERFRILY